METLIQLTWKGGREGGRRGGKGEKRGEGVRKEGSKKKGRQGRKKGGRKRERRKGKGGEKKNSDVSKVSSSSVLGSSVRKHPRHLSALTCLVLSFLPSVVTHVVFHLHVFANRVPSFNLCPAKSSSPFKS